MTKYQVQSLHRNKRSGKVVRWDIGFIQASNPIDAIRIVYLEAQGSVREQIDKAIGLEVTGQTSY